MHTNQQQLAASRQEPMQWPEDQTCRHHTPRRSIWTRRHRGSLLGAILASRYPQYLLQLPAGRRGGSLNVEHDVEPSCTSAAKDTLTLTELTVGVLKLFVFHYLQYYLIFILTATPWLPHGNRLATTWLPLGYHLATIWLPFGYHLATTWLPDWTPVRELFTWKYVSCTYIRMYVSAIQGIAEAFVGRVDPRLVLVVSNSYLGYNSSTNRLFQQTTRTRSHFWCAWHTLPFMLRGILLNNQQWQLCHMKSKTHNWYQPFYWQLCSN